MVQFFNTRKIKVLNKNKVFLLYILSFILLIFLIIWILYVNNKNFRSWTDKYIFNKEISERDVTKIDFDSKANQYAYAYDKYICVLYNATMSMYTNLGNKAFDLEVPISNPIFCSNSRYLCIAEENGSKIYMISGENILWNTTVEGKIQQINVNKEGYVSVIISETSYKTVVVLFDNNGKELFTTYLATTTAVDTDISYDNKYLAIGEVDTTGTIIKSNIRVIDIDKAKKNVEEGAIVKYSSDINQLLINLEYVDKNKLVCVYNDSVYTLYNGEYNKFIDIENDDIIIDANMKNFIVQIKENSGMFKSTTNVNIRNIQNNANSYYEINAALKDVYINKYIIAINLGTEVDFIGQNGWLIKRYISNQEISNILLGDTIAGIVYRDRIEIVTL